MTTKIKTTLLTAFFFFALLSGLQAQDKYEYAVIQYMYTGKYVLTVSVNGDKYEESLIEPSSIKGKAWGWDLSPVLKKINEMQDIGWEVFSTGKDTNIYIYHLRKKKN